jgi:hypothetical protein
MRDLDAEPHLHDTYDKTANAESDRSFVRVSHVVKETTSTSTRQLDTGGWRAASR